MNWFRAIGYFLCCAELQCPHNCAHTILEHSDTWFIARVLIPWTNRGDINAIQCIVQRRHEMWTFAHFGLNETTVLSSITWFDRIRDSGTLQFTYARFLKWQQHDMNSHDDHPLKELKTMRINKRRNGWHETYLQVGYVCFKQRHPSLLWRTRASWH